MEFLDKREVVSRLNTLSLITLRFSNHCFFRNNEAGMCLYKFLSIIKRIVYSLNSNNTYENSIGLCLLHLINLNEIKQEFERFNEYDFSTQMMENLGQLRKITQTFFKKIKAENPKLIKYVIKKFS